MVGGREGRVYGRKYGPEERQALDVLYTHRCVDGGEGGGGNGSGIGYGCGGGGGGSD